KVRERFAGAELTISLDEVRTFRVHVCGAVTMPGSYLVPATARVADAILLAGGLLKRPKVEWDTTSAVVASERRIQVLAADTPDHWRPADLLLFEKAGRAQANPYLHDGDVIVVPFREEKDTQVGVFGGVFTPDLHEYAPGDRVTDLIALAGGTLSSANLFASYLVRADGRRMAISDSAALYTEVQPGDRLYVPMKYDPPRFGTVTLKGEIGEPGSYPIEIGKTTLSQVLKDAGGLLPTAAVNSARLIRAPTQFRDAEKVRLLRLRQTGNFTEEKGSHDRELAAAYERWLGTTVVFDLSNLLESASSDDDVLLQDGDMLEIPRYPFGVQILGLVNRSGEITYHENWDLNDYLRAAGGLNRGGWKSQTRVVKASSGSVVLYTPKVRLDPGDIVFVPSKPPGTTWTQVKDGITMASQVATIALIVMTATKK
ncbi:MAG: hypothetical protein FJY66_06155, partial [Calditrichaeota bacterium]|nr:hypothetical protein [Calditrichota bacterium]